MRWALVAVLLFEACPLQADCYCACINGQTVPVCTGAAVPWPCVPIPGCASLTVPQYQGSDPCAGLFGAPQGACRAEQERLQWERQNCRIIELLNPQTGQPELRKQCVR